MERNRVTPILFVGMWVAPEHARTMARNLFRFRTRNIEHIERALGIALYASFSGLIRFTDFANAVNTSIAESLDAIEDDFMRDYTELCAATRKIQRNWRIVVSNPAYLVCRRRLEYEFRECTALLSKR